jgi:hypothetical protein
MANPIAYNSGTTVSGCINKGTISFAVDNLNYSTRPGNLNWYAGGDNTNKYIIISDTYSQGVDTQANSRPTMWATSAQTDSELLKWINGLPARSGQSTFSTLLDAISWLEGQGKYLISNQHYPQIVTSGMVLNMDAGFTGSYPNVGTNWYDLTKTQNPGVLTNGPTWSNSGMTSAMTFDGTNDYVSAGNFESIRFLGNSPYTLSVLTKLNRVLSNYPGWINRESNFNGPRDGYNLIYTIEGQLPNQILIFTERFTQGDQATPGFSVDRTYNLNKWFRIDSVYDGLNLKIFYNGNLMASNVSSGTITNNTKGLEIAQRNGTYNACDISKVNIYNRALSNSEILQNYYQGPIVTSGLIFAIDAGNLVSYGGTGTTVYDLTTTGVTGTLTNGPIWTYLSGGTFSFDGVDDYVILSSGLTSGTESFTISCFLKYSIPISTTFRDIINNRNISTALSGFLLTTDFSSRNGKIRVQLNNTTTVSSFISTGNKNIADNNWNQVVIVVNRITNLMTFFVNGIQEGDSFDVSSVGDISPGSNLQIGGDLAYNDTKAWFPGNISQVQIYNRALSESEIKQNFEAYRGRFGV